jgi:hypothetical protein
LTQHSTHFGSCSEALPQHASPHPRHSKPVHPLKQCVVHRILPDEQSAPQEQTHEAGAGSITAEVFAGVYGFDVKVWPEKKTPLRYRKATTNTLAISPPELSTLEIKFSDVFPGRKSRWESQ